MTVQAGTLEIRAVSQSVAAKQTATGLKVPANRLKIAEYAAGDDVITNRDVGKINTPDFRLLSRFFASSVHVPVRVGGASGVVSFWSEELDAFPPEAVGFLAEVAKSLGLEGDAAGPP
jgi:hypothetical protein